MDREKLLADIPEHNRQNIEYYIQRLDKLGVPLIFDSEHLRRLIGINKNSFYTLIENMNLHYHSMLIPKKTGDYRIISKPSVNLKIIQRWILDNILYTQHTHFASYGFEKNKSVKENAALHLNKKVVFSVDIEDFFTSIKEDDVLTIFQKLGYTEELSEILKDLCCFNGFLPQGAPTSPYLSNLYCFELDKEMYELCRRNELIYSRYADDITMSGDNIDKDYILFQLKIILDKYRFTLKHEKTHISYSGKRQLVTGILVNDKLNVSKEYRNNLRQEMYYLNKYGIENHLEKREDIILKSNYKEHLYGKVNYLKMFDEEKANKYLKILNAINW